ncbi:aminotransferase class I/II-fold pyridoxal phosphate-dependent enzyme [Porticoccus sp. GXU_MW_L64]
MPVTKSLRTYTTLGFYHKFSQLRSDSWSRLKEQLRRLLDERANDTEKRVARRGVIALMRLLERIEDYTAFPSKKDFDYLQTLYNARDFRKLNQVVKRIDAALTSDAYRTREIDLEGLTDKNNPRDDWQGRPHHHKGYFEVLVVDDFVSSAHEEQVRAEHLALRDDSDDFIYDVVTVRSFEDALIAVMINPNIQTCIIRYGYSLRSAHNYDIFQHYLLDADEAELRRMSDTELGTKLAENINRLRPEIDLYMVAGSASEEVAGKSSLFRRMFYREPGHVEQHSSVLRAIRQRYETPFFSALMTYARKPTGVFHALPISRGQSMRKSHWMDDFSSFYGANIFLAETSATSGGLDSLLQPKGPMKEAQNMAARAYGARETYFVTNGTSTANKIVVQGLVRPGDVVLVDRDCHKSHHYAMVMMGTQVSYLDSYPLNEYSMYGAVPLRTIKERLLQYKRAGRLDEVKMLILTNCTFDGVVYNVQRVMEECLAIKPDLIFLWDEAWFGFARFNPSYRDRTGMYSADKLRNKYRSDEYREQYQAQQAELQACDPDDDATWLDRHLLPDPDKVRVRVYATQSTHKTLTSLRQGSMIHIYDQDFRLRAKSSFDEAYMTHTSTSPNYQILASLDAGRRQVELEGYELVHQQVETAMTLREQIDSNPLLARNFKVLANRDMVSPEYRLSGVENYYDPETGWSRMEDAWANDEFVIDPTRVTLMIGKTGVDGDTFKNKYLMDKYNIQINKTSRNTVLFMTNIGTERSSVTHLIEVLVKIAKEIEQDQEEFSGAEQRVHERKVQALTSNPPPLPDFSYFHKAFRPQGDDGTPDGLIRVPYFLSYDEDNCEYFRYDNGEIQREMAGGRELVSAGFVTPYPPGFPILVPGQVVSSEIIDFLLALDVTEIHGYRPELGLKVFSQDVIDSHS